ncbi:MAG: Gfo/Idh/MocA family oxidoreductase [Spirochaetales bacterium]|nr:Gfo/Idh/MocA family oxidoreductase [Spirochaetales bacterium]
MKKYKWGVLGTGKIANRFAQALNNISDEAEFAAIGSRTLETAEKFAKKYNATKAYQGYKALVADPDIDVVYIGTPGKCHKDDVLMALNAGKNVLCEKAFALNAKEAEEMVAVARSKNLFLMEAMWTRFFPVHVKIRELIAAGSIGDVRGMHANFSAVAPGGPTDVNRFWDVNLGASALLDIGAYGVAFASGLFGKPQDIKGVAHIGEAGFDYQNASVISYEGGRIASIMSSQVSYDVKNAFVYGTEGKIEIDDPWYKPEAMTVFQAGKDAQPMSFPLGGLNGYEYEIREVMTCLDAGKKESSIVPLDESIEVMKTMDELRSQWGFSFPSEK